MRSLLVCATSAVLIFSGLRATAQTEKPGEWSYYGGSKGFTRYSALEQINSDNVKNLRMAWRRPGVDASLKRKFPDLNPSHYYKATPIMVDGVVYSPNAVGLLEAFNPANGNTIWIQQPFEATMKEASGQSMRGVDSWRSGADLRLLLVRGSYLYAVNAKDGSLYPDFGDKGRVNLQMTGPYTGRFHWTSGPIVVRDAIVVAGSSATNGAGDGGFVKEASPDNVRGYDVRTGKLLWTFDVVPKPGEPGYETWGNDSAKTAGNLSAWCPLSGDEKLGLVYLPFTAPTSSYYGGWRPGDNLYSDSLVAVDAQTGKMKWYYQMIHHDLWEYDNIGPVYEEKCSSCHLGSLEGGTNESPALKGDEFISHWRGKSLRALYSRILSTMPAADPGSLSEKETLDVVAYMLQQNGFRPGGNRSADTEPAPQDSVQSCEMNCTAVMF